MKNIFLYILLATLSISCVSKSSVLYLNNNDIEDTNLLSNYKIVYKPFDLLQINILSKNTDAVKDFNLPVVNFSSISNSVYGQPLQQSYLVDLNGFIDFPVLGKIKVSGKTRNQVLRILKDKLSPKYIKDPLINIRISNFKISILGDVRNPGAFNIPNEKITIFEALALAGDLNITGNRKKIRVLREENNIKKTYILDLTSKSTLNSPLYYLQQNDVVYVEQNYTKVQKASFTQNIGLFTSLTTFALTLYAAFFK